MQRMVKMRRKAIFVVSLLASCRCWRATCASSALSKGSDTKDMRILSIYKGKSNVVMVNVVMVTVLMMIDLQ